LMRITACIEARKMMEAVVASIANPYAP